VERASWSLRGGSDRPDSQEGGAFADVEVGLHRGTSDRSAGGPLMDDGATAIGRPSPLTQDREDSFEPGRDLLVIGVFDWRPGWARRVGPVDPLGASEAEHVLVRSSSARRMDRWGAKSPGAMPRRRGAAVVGLRLGGSRLDRWGGLRGYRAFRSAGFADAVACSAWRPRSLGASSRIRIGKGFPIADDHRPPSGWLACMERVERRSTAFRPSRPDPPPTMTIQVPSFSVGRRRPEAFSPAAVESGGDGC
jgi:hypothetical protein